MKPGRRTDAATVAKTDLHVHAPSLQVGGELVWPFDEDEVTAAWETVHAAGLREGDPVLAQGLELPAWWWAGTGLRPDPDAAWRLEAAGTQVGPLVVLHRGPGLPDVDTVAREALETATRLDVEAQARLEEAASETPCAADFPLGAYVAAPRHEAILVDRMRMPAGRIASWTTVGAGAAPSEFRRLQEAQGAYHVVLVRSDDGRGTVGIWAGQEPPAVEAPVRPVLRRLLRQEGAWRYGVKFLPA